MVISECTGDVAIGRRDIPNAMRNAQCAINSRFGSTGIKVLLFSGHNRQ